MSGNDSWLARCSDATWPACSWTTRCWRTAATRRPLLFWWSVAAASSSPSSAAGQAPGFAPRRERFLEGMPQMVTVKIRGQDLPLDALIGRDVPGRTPGQFTVRRPHPGRNANAERQTSGRPLEPGRQPNRFSPDIVRWRIFLIRMRTISFAWPEYKGKSNISRAWQLCQAVDKVKAMQTPSFVGILDCGFGFVAPFDYATGPQLNLQHEGLSVWGKADIGGVSMARLGRRRRGHRHHQQQYWRRRCRRHPGWPFQSARGLALPLPF